MQDEVNSSQERKSPSEADGWLNRGVLGIGGASLLSDVGHEVPTALLPGLLTGVLGAPPAALGIIEGVADGLAGIARLVGGRLADDPQHRRAIAIGGYASTAILSSLIGVATAAWQVGILRIAAWSARGLRVPARNAILADLVPQAAYGRAYGFERAMDNLGAIIGPLLALLLVALFDIRSAILIAVIPGLLAAASISYAITHTRKKTAPAPPPPPAAEHTASSEQQSVPVHPNGHAVLRGDLGSLFVGIGAFEIGNVAATLLILRATEVLIPDFGVKQATLVATALYTAYNIIATVASLLAGRLVDLWNAQRVLTIGVAGFALAYGCFAITGPQLLVLFSCFVLAGIAIGCVETAEHAAVATFVPAEIRGSAFGVLAAIQGFGNLAASGIAGMLWTTVSAPVAFWYLTGWMVVSLTSLLLARRPARGA